MSRAELARAVPPASRRIRSQREALRAGLSCPELADVRPDFRRSLEAWWRILVGHTSWGGENAPLSGITSHLSRDTVCRKAMTGRADRETGEAQPMSISVFKRCRRWWAELGYVGTVREGTTPELERCRRRRGVHQYELAPLEGNRTPVYVLCVPRKTRSQPAAEPDQDGIGPLSTSPRDVVIPTRAKPAAKPGSGPRRQDQARVWPLRGVSDGWWAHLTRPFTAAGWNPADLTFAIDHGPDGRQHRQRLDSVRHPAGWLRWRLSGWLGPDGGPLPSPSQRRAAAAAAHRAELAGLRTGPFAARAAQIRAARAQAPARPGPAPAGTPARELLAQLRARLGRPLGPRWQDPARIATEQAAAARAARAAGHQAADEHASQHAPAGPAAARSGP